VATIGNVNVRVSATTIGLTKGLGSAVQAMSGFGARISGLVGRFGPLAAAITGVAGAAGLGLLVKNSFAAIDVLAKTSDKLGIGTEALAGLRHAADLSGVSAESLDNSLQRMTRGISEVAKEGKGPAKDALDELGLSADRLAALSPDQQFVAITAAMQGVANQSDKVRLAFDIFGRSGVDTLNIMQGGVGALTDTMQEAQDLGLGVSREDAAAIEEANDAITRVKSAFIGVANSIAVTVAPLLKSIADRTVEFGKQARGAFLSIRPIVTQTGNVILSVWDAVASTTQAVFGALFGTAQSTLAGVGDFLLDALIIGEFAFRHIGAVSELAWAQVQLGAIGFWEDLRHLFTAEIPAVLTWFAGEWGNIWFTAVDYVLTVLINLGTNIRSLWSGVLDFIAGRGFTFDWTPLSEGFVSTVSKLPDIPERALTEIERQLGSDIDRMSGDLTEGLADHLQQRRAELLGDGEAFRVQGVGFDGDGLGDAVGRTAGNAPEAFDFGLSQAAKQALALQSRGAAGESPEQKTAKELAALKAQQKQQADAALTVAREQLAALRAQPKPASIL